MPWLIALSALTSVFSSFQQSEGKRKQQEHEADVLESKATAKDQQAEITRRQVEIEKEAFDRDAILQKRRYVEAAGTNKAILAAGNVDISSGSALDLLEGNLNRFADDAGELEYQKELSMWTGKRDVDILGFEAELLRSNASFLDRTAGSVGQSLLTAGLEGFSTGTSTFISAGGRFKKGGNAVQTPKSGNINFR